MAGNQMNDMMFQRLARLVHEKTGIYLDVSRKAMLESRLNKILRARQITSFESYYRLLISESGEQEILSLINAISTNTTHFFREEAHFHFLRDVWSKEIGLKSPIRIWCAASSSGEEPYSIVMTLKEIFPGRMIELLASDIDTNMLKTAEKGVYHRNVIDGIPTHLLHKYFQKGKGEASQYVKARNELRNCIRYQKINLIESFPAMPPLDIIFCRNVMIYFVAETKTDIVNRMYDLLVPGGYLFIGSAESLKGLTDRYKYIAPAVYRKPA